MTAPDRNFLPFSAPDIGDPEISEVVDSLRTGWLGTGPKVAQFERAFAEEMGAEHAIAVNSCTAALHLSLVASDIGPGDEVITTPLTFCATVNAVLHTGAKPVLVDVEQDSFNIDPDKVADAITERTKALLPVHFAGRPCDMEALQTIARDHDLLLIEDAAHAIESSFKGKRTGTFGDFGCFSFYATKNLVTGEGGMVLVKDEEKAKRVRRLSLHGLDSDAWKRFSADGYRHYQVTEPGFKYNMMDLQASIGIHQLRRLWVMAERRRQIWQRYNEGLVGLPVSTPVDVAPHMQHAYHLYTVLIQDEAPIDRDAFLVKMTQQGIGVGVHYQSLPEHPYYQSKLGWTPDRWPIAADIGRRTLSLPLSASMTDTDVDAVVRAARKCLKEVSQ